MLSGPSSEYQPVAHRAVHHMSVKMQFVDGGLGHRCRGHLSMWFFASLDGTRGVLALLRFLQPNCN